MSTKDDDAAHGCVLFVFGLLCATTAWRFCALGPPWLNACAPLAAGVAWLLGVCVLDRIMRRKP